MDRNTRGALQQHGGRGLPHKQSHCWYDTLSDYVAFASTLVLLVPVQLITMAPPFCASVVYFNGGSRHSHRPALYVCKEARRDSGWRLRLGAVAAGWCLMKRLR